MKMKAVFEVKFDKEFMISEENLKECFDGDFLKFMQELFKEEGFGIFDNEIKLVDILEEEKKIPEKLYGIVNPKEKTERVPNNEELMYKINEIIDYLKSKGE